MGRKSKERREQGAANRAPFCWPGPAEGKTACRECWYDEDGNEIEDESSMRCRPGGEFDPVLVARAYIEHEDWVFGCVSELAWDFPEACFELVKVALPLCRDDEQRAYLAAGALESMLGSRGERMIAAVEAEAHRDPAFAKLLSGVWQHGMSEAVWARVLAASGRVAR